MLRGLGTGGMGGAQGQGMVYELPQTGRTKACTVVLTSRSHHCHIVPCVIAASDCSIRAGRHRVVSRCKLFDQDKRLCSPPYFLPNASSSVKGLGEGV